MLVDPGILCSRPDERKTVLDAMLNRLAGYREKPDVLVSVDTDAICMTSLMAQRLRIPMTYLRPQPKLHGTQKQLEGSLRPGDRAVLVSSNLMSEQSVRDSRAIVERYGGSPLDVLSISPGKLETGESPLGKRDVSPSSPNESTSLTQSQYAGGRGSAEPNKKRVAEVLLEIGAVTVNRTRPYRFVSGLLSPIYTDNRLLMSYPAAWNVVVEGFLDVVNRVVGRETIDFLAGTATSGIPHASLIADEFNLPLAYVAFDNDTEPDHGRMVGQVNEGDRAVLIEDHVTTGKSVLSAAKELRRHGARVEWCLAIFTYDEPKTHRVFKEHEIRFATLCDLPTLLDVAIDNKLIGSGERDAVLDWVRDPEEWTAKEEAGPSRPRSNV